jgi:hypothetical protein
MLTSEIADQTFKSVVRLHLKILSPPTRYPLNEMLNEMRKVYEGAKIRVDVVSTENLNLPELADVDVGECTMGSATEEQTQLFSHRNNVQEYECSVYFVRSTLPPYNGCAAHPDGRPGCVVVRGASKWTLGHEVGHVLGLFHVNNSDNLMTGNGTNNITNPPPDLTPDQISTMEASNVTINI